MVTESKVNFITIKPHERMAEPTAIFNILRVGEEDTTEYYPIVSNFYDAASWLGIGNLKDLTSNSVPPQALQNHMVNKIEYGGGIYWLSEFNNDSVKYSTIGNTKYITISTTDDWNTYTVTRSDGSIN